MHGVLPWTIVVSTTRGGITLLGNDWGVTMDHSSPVPALRMSVDTHHPSEFQGERVYFLGHFTDFTVLEIVENGGILLTTYVKSSNKGSYLDLH